MTRRSGSLGPSSTAEARSVLTGTVAATSLVALEDPVVVRSARTFDAPDASHWRITTREVPSVPLCSRHTPETGGGSGSMTTPTPVSVTAHATHAPVLDTQAPLPAPADD